MITGDFIPSRYNNVAMKPPGPSEMF
jgi:hypothetical protein